MKQYIMVALVLGLVGFGFVSLMKQLSTTQTSVYKSIK